MKHHPIAAALVFLVACGQDKGPGITGEYFTRFEAMGPSSIELPELSAPGKLVTVTPAGNWIVTGQPDLVLLVDPNTMTTLLTFDEPPSHALAEGGFLTQDGHAYSPDGGPSTPLPLPEGLTVTDIDADVFTNTIYAGGVAPLVQGQPELVGQVYASTDLGQSWEIVANVLRPVQGDAASVNFVGVTGWLRLGVCPPSGVYEGGSPICETYSLHGDSSNQGFRIDHPTPIAYDADGRVIALGEPEETGPNTPGLVLTEPENHAQSSADMDHFHTGMVPIGVGSPIAIDGEGTMWVEGWSWDGHQIFRSVEPLGSSHDQRDSVLDGKGCDDLYNKERKQGFTGDEMDVTLTNDSDELIWVDGIQRDTLSFVSVDIPHKLVLEPGESGTVRHNEDAWLMAYTPDGRCKGFGPSTKMDGRSIR